MGCENRSDRTDKARVPKKKGFADDIMNILQLLAWKDLIALLKVHRAEPSERVLKLDMAPAAVAIEVRYSDIKKAEQHQELLGRE